MLAASRTVGRIVLARRLATFGIDNQSSLWQEFVHHLDSGTHVTTRVATQVDDEPFAIVLMQLGQGNQHFRESRFSEFLDIDITIFVIHHIRRLDALVRNVSTDDGEMQQFLFPLAEHAELHFTSFRTLQTLH